MSKQIPSMNQPKKPFSFFPEFDKEANNKLVSHIFAMSSSSNEGNPLTLLIKVNKTSNNGKPS